MQFEDVSALYGDSLVKIANNKNDLPTFISTYSCLAYEPQLIDALGKFDTSGTSTLEHGKMGAIPEDVWTMICCFIPARQLLQQVQFTSKTLCRAIHCDMVWRAQTLGHFSIKDSHRESIYKHLPTWKHVFDHVAFGIMSFPSQKTKPYDARTTGFLQFIIKTKVNPVPLEKVAEHINVIMKEVFPEDYHSIERMLLVFEIYSLIVVPLPNNRISISLHLQCALFPVVDKSQQKQPSEPFITAIMTHLLQDTASISNVLNLIGLFHDAYSAPLMELWGSMSHRAICDACGMNSQDLGRSSMEKHLFPLSQLLDECVVASLCSDRICISFSFRETRGYPMLTFFTTLIKARERSDAEEQEVLVEI